jgi:CheY-like chemotaxis protein
MDIITEEDRCKLVIADDSEALCSSLKQGLEEEGYVVHAVNDGFKLLAYLKENQDVEVVILDLMMPERSGMSIFNTIKSLCPATKIVIFSGCSEYRGSVFEREADAYIEKPEGLLKILEVLKRIV